MANTVHLKKGNRVLTVDKHLAEGYLLRGYDQIDENGKVVKEATGGKTISVAQHNALKAKVAELEASQDEAAADRIKELEAELEKMTEKAKEFADKGKALKEENDKLKAQLKK